VSRQARFIATFDRGVAAHPERPIFMLTLTGPGLDYDGVKRGLQAFRRLWRARYGWIEHHGACEQNPRDTGLHVQAACFMEARWVDFEVVRPMCVAAGFGARFEIAVAREAVARYVSKSMGRYLAKAPVSQRPLTTRGWAPPIVSAAAGEGRTRFVKRAGWAKAVDARVRSGEQGRIR
jgi:hypothetical protein